MTAGGQEWPTHGGRTGAAAAWLLPQRAPAHVAGRAVVQQLCLLILAQRRSCRCGLTCPLSAAYSIDMLVALCSVARLADRGVNYTTLQQPLCSDNVKALDLVPRPQAGASSRRHSRCRSSGGWSCPSCTTWPCSGCARTLLRMQRWLASPTTLTSACRCTAVPSRIPPHCCRMSMHLLRG